MNDQMIQQMYLNPGGLGMFDMNRLPEKAQPYKQWLMKAGDICDDVTPEIVAGVIDVESSWNPRANEGKTGVGHGLAQFTDDTWKQYGVDADGNGKADAFNGADAILSAGQYLCFLAETVRGYIRDGKIPNLRGPGSVRDLMIVGYNKGPYIWLPPHEWRGTPINYDSNGIPDATHSDGMTGQKYLARVNAAINRFRSPGVGEAVVGGARERMVAAAFAEVGVREWGDNCNPYSSGCFAWCAVFVSWIWNKAGYEFYDTYVENFYKWGARRGAYSEDFSKALPGDALIYDKPDDRYYHIGLIVQVYGDGTIDTIEGNSTTKVTHHKRFNPRSRDGVGYVTPMAGK